MLIAPFKKNTGMTLMELVIGLGVSGIVLAGMVYFFSQTKKTNEYIDNQASAQISTQKILSIMNRELRQIRTSETGAYPIESAKGSEVVFFSNVDSDALAERVRYFVQNSAGNNELKKGIVKPSGNPLSYNTMGEKIQTLSPYIDLTSGTIFSYYNADYTGSQPKMAEPITVSDVRLIKVEITIDNPNTPDDQPVSLSTQVSIRNLKDNL